LQERPFDVMSGGLRLEGALHEGGGGLAAVVLHPHPLYGGDMHNHVVVAVCETFADAGATTLRFNFRGTGRSEGAFDDGRGEADDARAAILALRERLPGIPLVLVGYSFGAAVAAAVASESALRALVLISPPVAFAPLPPLPDAVDTLVLAGDRDEVAPAETVLALGGPSRRVALAPGVGHTWWPGVEHLTSDLSGFASGLVPLNRQYP